MREGVDSGIVPGTSAETGKDSPPAQPELRKDRDFDIDF